MFFVNYVFNINHCIRNVVMPIIFSCTFMMKISCLFYFKLCSKTWTLKINAHIFLLKPFVWIFSEKSLLLLPLWMHIQCWHLNKSKHFLISLQKTRKSNQNWYFQFATTAQIIHHQDAGKCNCCVMTCTHTQKKTVFSCFRVLLTKRNSK